MEFRVDYYSEPPMKNDFKTLIELAAERQYKSSCRVGAWNFDVCSAGSFVVSHNGEAVVTCESNQITDARWGSRIAGVEVYDILEHLLAQVPQIHLDAMTVRTDDCLALFGYEGPSRPIETVPGLEDIDYYRAWVVSKTNTTDPEKMDHVVYWDEGNTWCEVLAVFDGVTQEEFIAKMHEKYAEWIQEESTSIDEPTPTKKLSFVDDVGYTEFEVSKDWYEKQPDKSDVVRLFHAACADDTSHFNDLTGKYYGGTDSLNTRLQSASIRASAAESQPTLYVRVKESKQEF